MLINNCNFSQIFLKFIINYFNVYYKISTPVVFCPSGLLSGFGIFSGLLSVHRWTSLCSVYLDRFIPQSSISTDGARRWRRFRQTWLAVVEQVIEQDAWGQLTVKLVKRSTELLPKRLRRLCEERRAGRKTVVETLRGVDTASVSVSSNIVPRPVHVALQCEQIHVHVLIFMPGMTCKRHTSSAWRLRVLTSSHYWTVIRHGF